MTDTLPLHRFLSRHRPSQMHIIRLAMLGGALMIAAVGAMTPLLGLPPVMAYLFIAFAIFDVGIAVVLPKILADKGTGVAYHLYADHLTQMAGGRQQWRLSYDNIERIEEDPATPDADRAAGLVDILLHTRTPVQQTGGAVSSLRITGVRFEEMAASHLKALADKIKSS